MGSIHNGHLSLIKESQLNCEISVVSIFVNPTQFSENEDFGSYPRDLEKDVSILKKQNVDVLFIPKKNELYPFNYSTYINEKEISKNLEGSSRPHFFKGVATIVIKLFNIIRPDTAYFGKKDFQQLRVIEKVVADLNIDVNIVGCETIREDFGLAMSSRNQYFSSNKQADLKIIYNSLKSAKRKVLDGERSSSVIINKIKEQLLAQINNVCIDYIEVSDHNSLQKVEDINGKIIISLAVSIDKVRLIDNIEIKL